MPAKAAMTEPLQVTLIEGEIVFLGDGPVNFSMALPAARETLRNLSRVLMEFASEDLDGPLDAPVILLVEDEPLIRQLGSIVLRDAGYAVIEAEAAAEALNALETGIQVHLLFTDIQLPGDLNGLELARLVRDRWPQVRLLVCSGQVKPAPGDLPSQGRFLSKPYRLDDMLRRVAEVIAA